MATATLALRVDPTKTGKYPINISEDLLRETSPRKRQRFSVQYNHQPTPLLSQPSRIRPAKDGQENDCTLLSNNENNTAKYRFKGTSQPTKSFALVYDPVAKAFTLNRIDAEYRFNLTSTPSNKDAAALAREFPHLDSQDPNATHDHINGGAINDEEEDLQDDTPDPDNPYDYRRFLHAHNASPAPSPRPSMPSSPVHRPQHHRPFASSPLIQASSSPMRRPRSHTEQAAPSSPIRRPRSRTDPKKPQRPRDRYLSPQPREEADADSEESDELIIDMGDSAPPKKGAKPWRSQLGVLNGEAGMRRRPMSMRSAASSMSPSVKGESADEKSDADVEEIDLEPKMDDVGSNGVVEEATGLGITNGDGWDEDNTADLEAELEKAMQANDEQEEEQQQQPQAVVEESSEESEED